MEWDEEMKGKSNKFLDFLLSIVITAVTIVLVDKFQVPNPNVILLTIIVYLTFCGGFASGIPSGIIVII